MTEDEQGPQAAVRRSSLIVTNCIKLTGLIVALNEILVRQGIRRDAIVVAVFMLMGAQISEELLMATIDRFLGRSKGS